MTMPNPLHPGEFIDNVYLNPLGISAIELAKNLNVDTLTVSQLLAKEIIVTPEMALRLSAVLGSSPSFWLTMQSQYSLWQAEQEFDMSGLKQILLSSNYQTTFYSSNQTSKRSIC